MNTEQARYALDKLRSRYFLLRAMEIILLSTGTFAIAYAISGLFIAPSWIKFSIAISFPLILFAATFLRYKLYRLSVNSFAQYLNQHYPQLEESVDLLIHDDLSLTSLQQLQKIKIVERFNLIYPEIKLPHRLIQSAVIFVVCTVAYFALIAFATPEKNTKEKILVERKKIKPIGDTTSIFVRSLSAFISPPGYTGIKPFVSQSFDLAFPEGSKIKWIAEFSNEPSIEKLIFSGRDSISFERTKNLSYTAQRIVTQSGFYQLQWGDYSKIHRSDYYKMEVIPDQSPKVVVKNLNQFTKLKYADLRPIEVKSTLSDDYGLTDALIVATVSKGSGESVKFREEKLRFTSNQKISGKQLEASRSLDLKKLGLEPGDELYFYVEAWDNKVPVANHNRTETFFIAVQDTASEITSVDGGLGVDVMPEYFRSQRQIIIDTEKLLRKKNKLSKSKFNTTSNELGYDQKVLRLRYGQFLGEEDEAGIGQEAAHANEGQEDVTKQFGHTHDTQNEHNLVEQKKDTHHHEGETKKTEEKEDPIKAFTHSHDDSEEGTFFIQSLKVKLKAAVTTMWDAELYLRLYEPAKSLPYQYKALNLLKEISNDSRIYVHRMGFDPPPLKEEKRLTADLSEIKTTTNLYRLNIEKDYSAIRLALTIVEKMIQEDETKVPPKYQAAFLKAGQALSIEAMERPVVFLKSLSQLKSLSDQQIKKDQMHDVLVQLRKSLWTILPHQLASPNKRLVGATKLDQEFLRSFENIK